MERTLPVRICVFEDAGVAGLQPLALTRPAFDLRCGALSLLERQLRHFGASEAGAVVRPELLELCRLELPHVRANDPDWLTPPAGEAALLVNARWLPPARPAALSTTAELGLVGEQVAYAVVPAEGAHDLAPLDLAWHLSAWKQQWPQVSAGGALIDHPWDLVELNAEALEQDYQSWRAGHAPGAPEGVSVVGPPERFLADPTARLEPLVLVDTTKGPVLVDRGAYVQAFSRLEGPCYVGPGTQVLAGRVRGSSFGPQCRIGGEVEASIVHGHSNKAHEGFLGHSYVGEWVNLGAGSYTSDLRNDYADISVILGGQKVETGRLKVGSFLGDHTKASIGCLFNTGSALGPFGMLVASGTLLPRYLPAFCQVSHGRVQERTDLRQMFGTAATALARRGRAWTEAHAEFFLGLYERTAGERRQLLRDNEQRRLRRVV
jgi:UDP-N-acetylglucosamine diphosphorylase/glucosamine-1-phosphate N-acetyltransferase